MRSTTLKTAALMLALLGAPSPAQGDPKPPAATADATEVVEDPIDALMARLAAMPGLYARFTESKTIGLLAIPLINHGIVRYQPPGRLLRTIEKPHPSQVLLIKDAIWLSEGTAKPERIDLGAHPAVQSFVGSFRSLLAGDRKTLDEHFELSLRSGEGEHWTLELRPRSEAMAKIVTSMTVSGNGEIVERLVIEEATGDVSDTRFVDVDPHRRYAEDEAARLFLPPV
ncbi:MAG: outer membrane lipoprotein carrier protein LolA [Nannocystaceae bacterium]|nr:outer membrane lipoprotein carrier protein LolA [Nannocystaceae bacterium]